MMMLLTPVLIVIQAFKGEQIIPRLLSIAKDKCNIFWLPAPRKLCFYRHSCIFLSIRLPIYQQHYSNGFGDIVSIVRQLYKEQMVKIFGLIKRHLKCVNE